MSAAAVAAAVAATVTLILKNNDRMEVPRAVLTPSALIQEMLSANKTEEDDNEEVPLPEVDRAAMGRVLEYLEHHASPGFPEPELEHPLKDADPKVWCKDYPWDAAFVAFEPSNPADFLKLMFAAKWLQIVSLEDLTAGMLASKIFKKTPDEIRAAFHLKQLSPEEMKKHQTDNAWIIEVVKRITDAEQDAQARAPAAAPAAAAAAAEAAA